MKNGKAQTIGLAMLMVFVACFVLPNVLAAPTGSHNVTLSIGNIAPTVNYVAKVSPSGSVDPTSGSTTTVKTEVHVNDSNGIGDISLVWLDYWYAAGGETNRSIMGCTFSGDLGSNVANYSCSANMQFYDVGGTWTIVAHTNDTSNEIAINTSQTFTYNNLQDISISVASIAFGTVTMGGSNAKATNDPQVITNLGNQNITTVNVTGYDVKHLTLTDNITATNFKVGAADDCNGVAMANATSKTITGVTVVRGAASTDDMYYCIPTVPTGLTNGNYAAVSNWVVTSIV